MFHCKTLSKKVGGAEICLKREDLNHTEAHKINHCLGEALLAKRMDLPSQECNTLSSAVMIDVYFYFYSFSTTPT